jgi:ADP-ribose pyrophosphatase YjhB (NUDIX family)
VDVQRIMKYCTACGGSLAVRVPGGDDRPRHVCTSCGTIHYQNPKIVTGCIVRWEGKILLCKRGIEPRKGYWTLPCGYMEEAETVEAGAIRETYEESLANVRIERLYAVVSLPEVSQVYMVFLSDLVEPTFAPTPESLEVGLVSVDEIPWRELAFPAVSFILRAFAADAGQGGAMHVGTCVGPPGSEVYDDVS